MRGVLGGELLYGVLRMFEVFAGGKFFDALRVFRSDGEAKEKTYAFIQEFAEQFRERHGSLACRDLLGYDLSTPAGRLAAKASGRVDTFCPGLVRSAAEILETLI